ncbi:MAG TPA: formyltransferase family protein [Longimicrobiaceae bacterium]|nr:formyltransferase family protein [Longimicrobiaceae bacterium]
MEGSPLRVALFAAGPVGLEVARFLGEAGDPPALLVLDEGDPGEMREAIAAAAGLPASRVLTSAEAETEEGVARMRAAVPDLGVLAWWPRLVREPVLSLPRLGLLNFHPSLLPYNRGKHYNFWALVEGAPFGVTLHWVDAGVDTGPIAFQAPLAVTWHDTGETLYHRAREAIVRLFRDSWPRIRAGDIPRLPQDPAVATSHRAAELEPASRVDLDGTYRGRELLNLLRARTFPPHPGAWFQDDDGVRWQVRVQIERVSPDGD